MSAVDASITALVTLLTMLFSISGRWLGLLFCPCLLWLMPPVVWEKDPQGFWWIPSCTELNNKVQESLYQVLKLTKSFSYQRTGWVLSGSQWIDLPKNSQTMKYDSLFDPMVLLFVGSSYVLTLLVGSLMVQKGRLQLNLVTFINTQIC